MRFRNAQAQGGGGLGWGTGTDDCSARGMTGAPGPQAKNIVYLGWTGGPPHGRGPMRKRSSCMAKNDPAGSIKHVHALFTS